MPLLDKTSRLDLLDLYNSSLPAKAENTYGGQSELLVKTPSLLRVRTTEVGQWEMRLLPLPHDTLVSVIYTLSATSRSSDLGFYDCNWHPVSVSLPRPAFEQFFRNSGELLSSRVQSLYATLCEAPVFATWDDARPVLIYRLSLDGIPESDRADAALCSQPVSYLWDSGKFVLQ